MPSFDSLLSNAKKKKFTRGVRPDSISRGEADHFFADKESQETKTPVKKSLKTSTKKDNKSSNKPALKKKAEAKPKPILPVYNALAPISIEESKKEDVSSGVDSAAIKPAVMKQPEIKPEVIRPVVVEMKEPNTFSSTVQTVEEHERFEILTSDTKIQRSSNPKAATIQDSSQLLLGATNDKIRNGFTRIPNDLLLDIVEGKFSKSEVQVLLTIARYTISFNKKVAPISRRFLEAKTNLQGRSIIEALKKLEQKGCLIKIKGGVMSPNQLGLNVDLDAFKPANKKVETGRGDSNVETYLQSVTPERRNAAEKGDYESLLRSYSASQVEQAFLFISSNGDEKGQDVKLKMAYLSKAMPDIVDKMEASHASVIREQERSKSNQSYFENANQEFNSKLSSHERSEILASFEKNGVAEKDGILKWYYSHQSNL